MQKEYIDLTIAFGARNPDGGYALTVRSRYGDAAGAITLPSSDPEYQALAVRLRDFLIDGAGLRRLGVLLFAALFRDQPVRTIYDQMRGATEATDLFMRLRLEFPAEATEAAALPWEFLYDPARGSLALKDVSVVRYPIVPVGQKPLMVKLPLKVLLTSAVTAPPTEIKAELAEVEQGLAELGNQIQITVVPRLTTREFQRRLREGFHIWHFVGHGKLMDDGQSVLLFEEPNSVSDDFGEPKSVDAQQLEVFLSGAGVRLVVLDACESSRLGTDPFNSIAPALIRAGVPAVVAMQFRVPDQSTVAFTSGFYYALAQGDPIDACVNGGRKAVMAESGGLDQPDWGIPTVYARIADGRLFELAGAPEPMGQGGSSNGGINVSVGSHNTIGNFQVGTFGDTAASASAGGAPTRLPQIHDKDGQPLQASLSEAVVSEAAYRQELLRLSRVLDAAQRRLAEHQLTQARYGSNTHTEIRIEIQDLDQQIYNLLKERAELRLGRLEELRRAPASDQEARTEAAGVLAEFLDDAVTLNLKEQQQLQNALKIPVGRSERKRQEQRQDQLRQQYNELRELSQNLGR